MKTQFIFIRHGAALDVEGRCIGHTDVALSPQGAEAIRVLTNESLATWLTTAQTLKGLRFTSSDLRRASDSASIIADALGVAAHVDARLREMNFGEWDGRLWSDIESTDGDRLRAWTERWASGDRPPGGESIDDLAARADDWIADAFAATRDNGGLHIAVSHAGFIRAAVSRLQRRPLAQMFDLHVEHARAIVVDSVRG